MLDSRFTDEDADQAKGLLFDPGDDEQDEEVQETGGVWTTDGFDARAAEVYAEYQGRYKRRFKWLRSDLFRHSLERELQADSNALLGLLQTYGTWDPHHDAKLDALHALLTETFPDQKVLVFSQFADTVYYLEAQLKSRGVQALAGVTGNSADPTQLAWQFSPHSNQRPGQGQPEHEFRVLVATDVLSEGQNLQDCHVVVNYDLPWAIIRIIQRAGRVDRIGQKAEEILCHSFLPADGVERIINLRNRVRTRLRQNAEVVGADEAFFEDESDSQTIVNLYHERSGILDGDPDSEVDLASHAYQIWKNAIGADPRLEKAVANLSDVVFSSRQHSPIAQRPEGVLVFMRTADGNDALAYVDREGRSITESQLEILSAAECRADTPRNLTTRATISSSSRASSTSLGRRSESVASSGGPPAPASARTPVSSSTRRPSRANCSTWTRCTRPSTISTTIPCASRRSIR